MKIQKRKQKNIVTRHFGTIDPGDIDSYLAHDGYSGYKKALSKGCQAIISELKAADLTERFNLNFNIAEQLAIFQAQTDPQKCVVCSALDSGPGLSTAAILIQNDPQSVLEGLLICGGAIDARNSIIMVDRGRKSLIDGLNKAIDQSREKGLFNMQISIIETENTLHRKDESVVLEWQNGELILPPLPPLFPFAKKPWQNPSIVLSAETLSNVSAIMQNGSSWYQDFGKNGQLGTKLLSVSGCVVKEGIVEVQMGTSLIDIIVDSCGGIQDNKALKLVQVGGTLGGCLSPGQLQLGFSDSEIATAKMLSDTIIAYDQETCVIDRVLNSMKYAMEQSCGKCVMCREGSHQLFKILSDAVSGKGKTGDLDLMTEISEGMQEGSLCFIGKLAPTPVIQTMKYFEKEYQTHIKRKNCDALVCKSYISYHILPDKCTGCGECLDECPEEAIEGKKKMIHVINNSYCLKCGTCFEICQSEGNAIVKAGSVKPPTPKKPQPVGSWKRKVV